MDSMGFGYNDLKKLNDRLIYASVNGFGSTGPYSNRPGYDLLIQAMGGMMSITGTPESGPLKIGVALTDVITGLYIHGAVLAALFERERTGKGQHVEVSLLESQIAALVNIGSSYLNAGVEPVLRGNAHPSIVPYQSFETKDGHIVIGAGNDGQFVRLCESIGHPSLASDERYLTNALRVENRKELISDLNSILTTKTTAEWSGIIPWRDLPVGPINSVAEVFADQHVEARHVVESLSHPTTGDIKLVRNPVRYLSRDGDRLPSNSPPPTLGEHTACILEEVLGLSHADVNDLRASGVIR